MRIIPYFFAFVLLAFASRHVDAATAQPACTHIDSAGVQSQVVAAGVIQSDGESAIGEPLDVAAGPGNSVLIADGSPGRILIWRAETGLGEFGRHGSGFYPTAVGVRGFFVYAIDHYGRSLLRFDKEGGYRDVLLNFDELVEGRRIVPYGMDIDASGRVAVTDIENHQVLLFGPGFSIDVTFGMYGSYDGQLDTPRGVSFGRDGEVIVSDSGNGRVVIFADTGEFRYNLAVPRGLLKRPRRAVPAKGAGYWIADPAAGAAFLVGDTGEVLHTLRAAPGETFQPVDVMVGRDGRLFVADAVSGRVLIFGAL